MESDRRPTGNVPSHRITSDVADVMCARAVDQPFNDGDHTPSWPDTRHTDNDVTAPPPAGEFPVSARRRRRAVPPAWRYSLPSSITHSVTALRQPVDSTLPPTHVSVSANDNEPVSGVGRRRACKYIPIGSRNATTESGPRVRPTCLRYSYWLTLDDRRYASKYSTQTSKYSTPTSDRFAGYENQLRRHFRPRSCEIIDAGRDSTCCRPDLSRHGEVVSNDDDDSVLLRHLASGHVTENPSSGQMISSSMSEFDVETDCGGRLKHAACPTVRLNSDDDPEGPVGDVSIDRSCDEVKGQRRLSLSKIGDSGLGASIHSEQTSPEETATATLEQSHHHQQQKQLRHRLSDKDDDDDENGVSECQCQTQCEGHCEQCVQGQGHIDDDDDDDDRTKLTRHKCKYTQACICTAGA